MRLLDLKYGRQEREAQALARLCYPIAVSIEVRQPATALKLLEASHDAQFTLRSLIHPYDDKGVERKLLRAAHSVRCTRGILKRLLKEGTTQNTRATAAIEVCDRLLEMLKS